MMTIAKIVGSSKIIEILQAARIDHLEASQGKSMVVSEKFDEIERKLDETI
jgi:hypothetical protein